MVLQERLRIGTRPSPLALKQVEEVVKLLKIESFEVKTYETSGDTDKTTPISKMEGTDFFTDTIEKALLNGEIDIAVHSAKDLADKIPEGLVIAAITKSIDPYDALVSKKNLKLRELPIGAKIGTSSKNRKEQLKRFRDDLQIVDIRGNVEERLALLDNNELRITSTEQRNLDAIVIAAAGLVRLGLEEKITQRIPFEIVKPHPLQGSLAIQTRKSDEKIIELFSKLDTRDEKE